MPATANNAALIERLDVLAGLLRQLVAREQPKPRRLLRVTEAAHYLHISRGQLRGLIQRGEIPVVKQSDGNHVPWLIDVKDCDAWIERSKT